MSKGIYRRVHKQPYSDMPDHVETILMKLTREELRLSYNAVCNAYLAAFCEKHGYDYEPDAWVGDDPGGIAEVGEVVAVAQSYYHAFSPRCDIPVYGADRTPGWRNKLFVRADLMPHQIRITGIKCEQLQDISEADCLKEGLRQAYAESILGMYGYIDHKGTGLWFNTPREAFAALIDKVSGRGTWASNPWVVAYEFELVK